MTSCGFPHVRVLIATASTILLAAACQEAVEPTLPTPEQVASYYAYGGAMNVEINGNLAEITVSQPTSQLRRGGTLWAKVGPYVLLFSQETRNVFEEYPALAGIRVVTRVKNGPEVARATLERNELTDILWRRALNIAGKARRDGTVRPTLLDDLVRWGEDHTRFEYNERYIHR